MIEITHTPYWPGSAAKPKEGEYIGSYFSRNFKYDIYLKPNILVYGDGENSWEFNDWIAVGLHLAAKQKREITFQQLDAAAQVGFNRVDRLWKDAIPSTKDKWLSFLTAALETLSITVVPRPSPGETLLARIKGLSDAEAAKVLDEELGKGAGR